MTWPRADCVCDIFTIITIISVVYLNIYCKSTLSLCDGSTEIVLVCHYDMINYPRCFLCTNTYILWYFSLFLKMKSELYLLNILFIPRHTIVIGYYGFTLDIHVSVRTFQHYGFRGYLNVKFSQGFRGYSNLV